MFKYRVKVPKPSADRLNHEKTFYIDHYGSFCGTITTIFKSTVQNNIDEFDILLPNEFEFLDESLIDSSYNSSYFIFKNSTGSRTERIGVLLERNLNE